MGGHVNSSRTWYREEGGQRFGYSVADVEVPDQRFDRTLRYLRALAVHVLEETVSGQTTTAGYADLQSRLRSLEATRVRILELSTQAGGDDEVAEVAAGLAFITDQIAQVQERISSLQTDSNNVPITIHIQPVLQSPTPTPTSTPTSTPTPTPTPTVVPTTPWDPAQVFEEASGALVSNLHLATEVVIWFGVAVLPFLVPLLVGAWVIRRWIRFRKR
jgi:hypothetical protein